MANDFRLVADEIKSRLNIAELISSYGINLQRSGSDYVALCPFHQEKTPSFHIYTQEGQYHCFGCNLHGDVIAFVMQKEGLPYLEAIKKLASQCGISLEFGEDDGGRRRIDRQFMLHKEIAEFFHRCLLKMKGAETARKYLVSREIGEAEISDFKLGFVPTEVSALLVWAKRSGFTSDELGEAGIVLPPKGGHKRWYNRFAGRLIFPISDRIGRIVGFSGRRLNDDERYPKYINSPETSIFKKGQILYGLEKAAPEIIKSKNRSAIICEGQIDVIRCHAHGFKTAVASEGTGFTKDHLQVVKQIAKEVVIAFDGDTAGVKAALKVGREFMETCMMVSIAVMPKGEDPDLFLKKNGADAFADILANACSLTAFMIRVQKDEDTSARDPFEAVRIASDIIDVLKSCPSAILRDSLMNEAARLLRIDRKAFKEDLQKRVKSPVSLVFPRQGGEHTKTVADAVWPKLCCALANCSEKKRKMCGKILQEGRIDDIPKGSMISDFIALWKLDAHKAFDEWHANKASVSQLEDLFVDSEFSTASLLKDYIRRIWKSALRERYEKDTNTSGRDEIMRLIYSATYNDWKTFVSDLRAGKKDILDA